MTISRKRCRMVKINSAGVLLTLMLSISLMTIVVLSCNNTNKNTAVVNQTKNQVAEEPYSDFLDQVNSGNVVMVKINYLELTLDIELKNKKKYRSAFPPNYDVNKALEGKVKTIIVDQGSRP